MPQEIAIEVADLQHAYGTAEVLRNAQLSVPSGAIVGLLGPNGSGKSTLFRILSTLIPLQSGRVTMLGHDLKSQARRVRELIGVSFQSPALDTRLTIAENLVCQARIYGLSAKQRIDRTGLLLSQFGLEDRVDELVGTLSGGFRRRVELVKALLHNPAILLLDEPTTGLDPASRRDFWKVLKELRRQQQTTMIVATHLMDEAEFCDSLALLCDGRIVATGAPLSLRADLGHNQLRVRCHSVDQVNRQISQELNVETEVFGDVIALPVTDPSSQVEQLLRISGDNLIAIEIARPTLEDVFLHHTGRSLNEGTTVS